MIAEVMQKHFEEFAVTYDKKLRLLKCEGPFDKALENFTVLSPVATLFDSYTAEMQEVLKVMYAVVLNFFVYTA